MSYADSVEINNVVRPSVRRSLSIGTSTRGSPCMFGATNATLCHVIQKSAGVGNGEEGLWTSISMRPITRCSVFTQS